MQEIEIGEWVRLKDGRIRKFMQYLEDNFIELTKPYNIEKIINIVKHSKNIIDLIEVGDYVNGYKVMDIADSIYKNSKRILIYRNEKEKYERWMYIQQYDGKVHMQDDIESITTKQQFESIEYKI